MTQNQQQDAFYEEILKVVDRFTCEYDLTVPSVVGVFEVIKMELMLDNMETEDIE